MATRRFTSKGRRESPRARGSRPPRKEDDTEISNVNRKRKRRATDSNGSGESSDDGEQEPRSKHQRGGEGYTQVDKTEVSLDGDCDGGDDDGNDDSDDGGEDDEGSEDRKRKPKPKSKLCTTVPYHTPTGFQYRLLWHEYFLDLPETVTYEQYRGWQRVLDNIPSGQRTRIEGTHIAADQRLPSGTILRNISSLPDWIPRDIPIIVLQALLYSNIGVAWGDIVKRMGHTWDESQAREMYRINNRYSTAAGRWRNLINVPAREPKLRNGQTKTLAAGSVNIIAINWDSYALLPPHDGTTLDPSPPTQPSNQHQLRVGAVTTTATTTTVAATEPENAASPGSSSITTSTVTTTIAATRRSSQQLARSSLPTRLENVTLASSNSIVTAAAAAAAAEAALQRRRRMERSSLRAGRGLEGAAPPGSSPVEIAAAAEGTAAALWRSRWMASSSLIGPENVAPPGSSPIVTAVVAATTTMAELQPNRRLTRSSVLTGSGGVALARLDYGPGNSSIATAPATATLAPRRSRRNLRDSVPTGPEDAASARPYLGPSSSPRAIAPGRGRRVAALTTPYYQQEPSAGLLTRLPAMAGTTVREAIRTQIADQAMLLDPVLPEHDRFFTLATNPEPTSAMVTTVASLPPTPRPTATIAIAAQPLVLATPPQQPFLFPYDSPLDVPSALSSALWGATQLSPDIREQSDAAARQLSESGSQPQPDPQNPLNYRLDEWERYLCLVRRSAIPGFVEESDEDELDGDELGDRYFDSVVRVITYRLDSRRPSMTRAQNTPTQGHGAAR